jgi:hypothetical protein
MELPLERRCAFWRPVEPTRDLIAIGVMLVKRFTSNGSAELKASERIGAVAT